MDAVIIPAVADRLWRWRRN